MNKVYYKDATIKAWVHDIIRAMQQDNWRPDYVVGLTRGGLVPANLISQYLDIPMHTLKINLRDHAYTESNSWMARDAFGGYLDPENPKKFVRKNILIVDDINDSGATLNWIKQDWQTSHNPEVYQMWEQAWNENVRFAVLVHNESSEYKRIDYSCINLNKAEDDCWIVFPWEDWWKK